MKKIKQCINVGFLCSHVLYLMFISRPTSLEKTFENICTKIRDFPDIIKLFKPQDLIGSATSEASHLQTLYQVIINTK